MTAPLESAATPHVARSDVATSHADLDERVLLVDVPVATAIRCLLLVDLSIASLYLLDQILRHPAGWFASRLVDLARENNLPTWYTSAQLLVLGLLLGLFALAHVDRRQPRSWLLAGLPLLAFAMSLDEVASIHEWLGRKSDALLPDGSRVASAFDQTGIWMLILGPLFLAAVAILWRGLRPWLVGQSRIVRLYVAGLATYLGSALGIELLSNVVARQGVGYVLQEVCEELGEMIGVTLLIWATLELLHASRIHVRAHVASRLGS